MFNTIKSQVPLLEVIKKDTGLTFKQTGQNYVIENEEEQGGCSLCGHKDCFKVKVESEEDLNGFFHCFSCEAKGDVIAWRSAFKKITLAEAARELASEYKISLPNDWSPVQHLFAAAARYYENCFWDTCNKPYSELSKKTPSEYQKETRGHSETVLKEMHVGWSDGGLIDYLDSVGFDAEVIDASGLKSAKTGKDFFAPGLFMYPQLVRGRVSHFTMKDPSKRLTYQLPSKFTLNSWAFYNQDSLKNSNTVFIVEGENDLLSCMDSGKVPSVIATIGQLSGSQLEWMREALSTKNVLTMFDPDDAGWKYRVKVEKMRKYFKNLAHVLPPEGKDIDDHLRGGADIEALIKANLVKVDVNMFGKEDVKPVAIDIPWDNPTKVVETPVTVVSEAVVLEGTVEAPIEDVERSETAVATVDSFQATLAASGLSTKTDVDVVTEKVQAESVDEDDEDGFSTDGSVVQRKGAYWRVKFKEGEEIITQISDFTIHMSNVFLMEGSGNNGDEGRRREVVIHRQDGYRSDPIMVNDDTKVNLRPFKVLMARAADAFFRGSEDELSKVWTIVNQKSPSAEVRIPRIVGRNETYSSWIFRNKMITDSGDIIDPDENGIFWRNGRVQGIRPESLSKDEGGASGDRSDIPALFTDITKAEVAELLKGVIENVGKNLNSLGSALTMVGWTYSSVYSNFIFDMNKGFPFLFFWGVNGQGKSTVAKWISQDFYGINGYGSTSVPNLRSGVGWARKSEYYASMPLFVDEVRSDEDTKQYLGVFRSYYDREARTMGVKEAFGVKTVRPRAVFVFNGEDQFEDPATRERCIPIRIPVKDRELQESYRWMEAHKHLFTGILYYWILEFAETMRSPEKKEALKKELRELDKELMAAGCSQRVSKNWAVVGVFGMRLCAEHVPDFDYKGYLLKAAQGEAVYQKSDTTLSQFWELVEGIMAQENSSITDKHIVREGNKAHIWFPEVFRAVKDETRGKFAFSKNAVLSAIREEPYYVSNDKKISVGLDGVRRLVMTLDLEKAPDSIRNIALAN